MDSLTVFFLAENEQTADSVMAKLIAFIGAAKETLDFAVYDMRLSDPLKATLVAALKERADAGVKIRFCYDGDKPLQPNVAAGQDPVPPGTGAFVQSLGYPFKRIGGMKLMHSKFIVRDGKSVGAGSTNFTDDAFTLMENNIVLIDSPALAAYYAEDFDQLWEKENFDNTGDIKTVPVPITFSGETGPSDAGATRPSDSALTRRLMPSISPSGRDKGESGSPSVASNEAGGRSEFISPSERDKGESGSPSVASDEAGERSESISPSGRDAGEAAVREEGTVRVMFSPGCGPAIDSEIASRVRAAKRRVRICSLLINSGTLINELGTLLRAGRTKVDGIYDRTQMADVYRQWQEVPSNHWKIPALKEIIDRAGLVGKDSTPYTPTGHHNFMHNKILVIDDSVITGSYNFSRSAEFNAENILFIESPGVAAQYSDYIDHLIAKYRH